MPTKMATLTDTSERQSPKTEASGSTTATAPSGASRNWTVASAALVVGERDFQHAGARAEGGERLRLADDVGERDVALPRSPLGSAAMTLPAASVT